MAAVKGNQLVQIRFIDTEGAQRVLNALRDAFFRIGQSSVQVKQYVLEAHGHPPDVST